MADKQCFVQFSHPGGEHKPDGDCKIGWNKTHRWNKTRRKHSVNPHKRKFMQFRGKWIDEDGITRSEDLRVWGATLESSETRVNRSLPVDPLWHISQKILGEFLFET